MTLFIVIACAAALLALPLVARSRRERTRLDRHGTQLGLTRLPGERNAAYRARLRRRVSMRAYTGTRADIQRALEEGADPRALKPAGVSDQVWGDAVARERGARRRRR